MRIVLFSNAEEFNCKHHLMDLSTVALARPLLCEGL
jgi:hypothetical protein